MKLKILICLIVIGLFTFTAQTQAANISKEQKCQEAMRSSYGKSYESLAKSVTKVSESLSSLSSIGVNISTTSKQLLAGMPSRLENLSANITSLIATSDANGQDCVKGTGEVHTKAVAVKAEIAKIKGDLNYITSSVRSLTDALKGVTKYEGYAKKYEQYYSNINQKISGGGDKVTAEITNYQAAWNQKIQEYKADVAALKKMIVDLYAAGNRTELNKIKLSLNNSVNSRNEKIEQIKKVKTGRSNLIGMYNNIQRLLINAGITVLGASSTNKATGLTIETATGELTN